MKLEVGPHQVYFSFHECFRIQMFKKSLPSRYKEPLASGGFLYPLGRKYGADKAPTPSLFFRRY
jgi:hypothetical protein